jgi:DNA processing protein
MTSPHFYQVALSFVPNLGPVHAKLLLQQFPAEEIFKTKRATLERVEGIGSFRANAIRAFRDFDLVEKELKFLESRKISVLPFGGPGYPKRLRHCYDPPTVLYMKGETDLNARRVIGIIGTRRNSDYGRQQTEKLVHELQHQGVIIISGLAYGIDAIAHRACLKNNIPTVAVLAHGLNQVYPPGHIPVAKDMIENGGALLTEFNTLSKPDRHNFPVRNRIVAGLCDAIVVMETDVKGGSMITAELANGYNREVFAFPGRATDSKSAGCHRLIRQNKAMLLTEASELVEAMGWNDDIKSRPQKIQKELFVELTPEETKLVNILEVHEEIQVDELFIQTGMNAGMFSSALLSLECKGVIASKPGKRYFKI